MKEEEYEHFVDGTDVVNVVDLLVERNLEIAESDT